MNKIIDNFLNLFVSFFKIMEENKQITIVRSFDLDNNGLVKSNISPLGSEIIYSLYPYQIVQNIIMKSQFRSFDIKLLESVIFAEGDIFIHSKDYYQEDEVFTLQSVITKETWRATKQQILDNKELYLRLNKRYFDKHLNDLNFNIVG